MSSDRPGVFQGDSWWATYRAHGDPYPLDPRWIEHDVRLKDAPFPQRGEWVARSLNTLAMHAPNSDFSKKLRDVPPNRAQQSVVRRIADNLVKAGSPPEGMTGNEALNSMSGGKSLYNEEPRNLANYEFSKVKVLHSELNPRRLEDMLPRYAKSVLQKYQNLIELSNQELVDNGPIPIQPYWDPKLRHSDKQKVELIVGLANKGLVTFRQKIKEKIGIFFVRKKTPEWIRMVIDSRRVNASHREPPCTRLSTPRSFLDMQLEPSRNNEPLAFGLEADVNDCFYNYFTETLASWFGIDRRGSIGFWKQAGWKPTALFDEDTGGFSELTDEVEVYPVFRGLCMGWSWSLYFANESVNFLSHGMIERPLQQIRDKMPVPSLEEQPIIGVYVDNISIIGRTKQQTADMAEKVQKHFKAVNVPITWTESEPKPVFETVGIVIDFNNGEIRNKPKRLWKAFLAGREILRRKRVPTKLLEFWLGHMTSIFMITPSALSCFFDIYRYIDMFRSRRGVIWGSVRQEMRTALGLMWMTTTSIVFDPVRQVDAGDSSSGAFALLTTLAEKREIKEVCKWREIWRYQPMAQTLKTAVETGSRSMVIAALEELEGEQVEGRVTSQEVRPAVPTGAAFRTAYADWLLELLKQDKTWHKTSAMATQFRSHRKRRLELDVASMIPPVPDKLCEAGRYSLLWRRRWRTTDWHINAKEAQVCLSSIRRAARVTELHGRLKLTLTDNLPALCCFERGRSSSNRLNKICQQACAYQMGTGIRWRLRHVESLRNPADRDSRFHPILEKHQKPPSNPNRPSRVPLNPRREISGYDIDSAGHEQGRHPSQSSSKPLVERPRVQKGGMFLELFAGTARLTGAFREADAAVLRGIDIVNGNHHDLRRRTTQLIVLHWLTSGRVRYVHLGTPCTVYSRARHFIRNVQRARDREFMGVEFELFTAEVIETCNRYNIAWSLENPRQPRLFEVPFLAELLQSPAVYCIDLDFCMYGELYKKPTRIYTSESSLVCLGRRCNHKRHATVLRGSERVFQNGGWISQPKTQRAGAYPTELVKRWAQAMSPCLAPSNRENRMLEQQCEHELVAVKETENPGKQIQTVDQLCRLTKSCIRKMPDFLETIVFGQYTNAEASRRRKKAQKIHEFAESHKIPCCGDPS